MSGTDAAATLTLEISTTKAQENLVALNAQYEKLHKNAAQALPDVKIGAGSTAAVAPAFTSISTGAKAAEQSLTHLGQQASQVFKGMTFNFEPQGAWEPLKKLRENMGREMAQIKTQMAKDVADLKAIIATMSAVQADPKLAKTGVFTRDGKERTPFIAKTMLTSAEMTGKMPGSIAAQATADSWISDNKDILANDRMAKANERYLASIKTQLEARNKALVGAVDKSTSDLVVEMRRANTARQKAESESLANQWIAENKDALQASSVAAAAKAKLEARNKALVGAVDKSTSDLVVEMRRANAARQKAESEWLALTDRQRASATLQASKALYGGGQQNVLPGVAGSSQALASAQSAGSVAAAESSLSRLTNTHRTLAPAIQETADRQIHWNRVAAEGHTVVRGLAGSLGTLWMTYGQLVPLLAGAALGSAFAQAAKSGSDFVYQLTFVKALSQETSAAVDVLGKSALALSQSSLQGPNEIASGYRILAQAGLDVTSSLSAMPHVMHLATVGEMSMEQSAVTLVGVMNAFGLSVGNLEHVGDVFAKAAALSQTSVQAMTEAMKTASVVGEQYGASMEDAATAVTLLAKVNIIGTSAGTAFRNMLKEIYAPTPAAADAFKRLGISTQDAMGNIKSFADVVFDLKGKLEGFNKGDQIKILQRLFGERGAKEAVAMLALTKDKWLELRDAINNSEGFMSGVSRELEDTAKGRWAQALNTMKSTLIGSFTEMEPAFSSLADSFKNLFSDSTFVDGLKNLVGAMLSLTKAVVEAAPALITLAEAYLILKTAMIGAAVWEAASVAVMGYSAALLSASGAMGPVARGTTVASTALSMLPAGFAALLSPMGLVVGGLAAAGLAFYLFRDRTAEAMDASTDKIRGFAREAKVLLDEVSRTLHNSSVAMSQARVNAAQTAVMASNERLDEMAGTYAKSYGLNGKTSGVEAVASSAAAYVANATSTNSAGEIYTKEDSQYKSARALLNARQEARDLQDKFYKTQDLVRQKEEGEANLEALKLSQKPNVAKRNADEILGKESKGAGGANRGEAKDFRSILNDNLSSGLKQEQIQLGREVIEIETQLAAQSISATVAQQQKNEATKASIEIERLWIEQSLRDAKAAEDKVQITKFQNDLLENSLKLEKQLQQTLLDTTKSRTADRNSIEDMSWASSRYVEDLQFEQTALGKMSIEVANLRIEREKARAVEDLGVKVNRKQINPDVVDATQKAIEDRTAAQVADAEFQNSWLGGWKKAFDEYSKRATNAATTASDAFNAMSSSMENAIDSFVKTGKVSFSDLVTSMLADIVRIQMRAALAPITQGMGGWLSGLFGGGTNGNTIAGVMVNGVAGGPMSGTGLHSGGIVGSEATFMRNVDPSVFSGARRFHTGGIVGSEVPAILKKGEGVFTPGQMKAMGGSNSAPKINVTINNQGAADGYQATAKARQNEGGFDIEVIVAKAVQSDMRRNGPITQGFGSVFGLARAV